MQSEHDAGGNDPRRLFLYSGGFWRQRRLRRILELAGYRPALGWPRADDAVGVWGQSPYATRGESVAQRSGATLIRIEDAFIRSLHPGRAGEAPMGLMIDTTGVHFDGRVPSDMETLLNSEALDNTALLDRARSCTAWMKAAHLSKYSACDPNLPLPDPGYVLVIDQTFGDASVVASGANRARFVEMLVMAQEENPGARVIIKVHPETVAGYRQGYFRDEDISDRVSFLSDAVSPWALLEGAVGVYTVSSHLGFEAILAGHRPRVFGQPFYAGWGLTQDDMGLPRRRRTLTRAQLFAGAMLLAPVWYDPLNDTRCELETVLTWMEARANALRADRNGWVAQGIRLWKRPALQGFFGASKRVAFTSTPEETATQTKAMERPAMVWGSADAPDGAVRVEDGFLRSRGLGAQLVPPVSLVCDDIGIYYDPNRPSRLERLIADSAGLRPDQLSRARALRHRLVQHGITKYNLGKAPPDLPDGYRILVPGQVEDDASIRLGAGDIRSNSALLENVRHANPQAVIIYKPHPDVTAGLRPGKVKDAQTWADVVTPEADIAQLLQLVDEVWTMTSLTGFEALMRGRRVVTLGLPFYAGWGMTRDLVIPPDRRNVPGITLDGLTHAALIGYPRYRDPVTGLPCPPEVIAQRLAQGQVARPGAVNRALSKLQGLMASQSWLWR